MVTWLCILARASSLQATPLERSACDALRLEHQTLLETGIKEDIARGAIWANTNLGQLRLQQIGRLFEVEEQIAFRCKGMALATAVVIPSLRTRKPVKTKTAARRTAHDLQDRGIKNSRVPAPVRRPALTPDPSLSSKTVAKSDIPKSEQANSSVAKDVSPKPTEGQLPKVIRLQKPKVKPGTKARQAKARQIRARRARKAKRRQRSDAYVPPPANPGYQPSLTSP